MNRAALVFPHQLFDPHPAIAAWVEEVVLVEDSLFFGDRRYPLSFHRQKLWLHRASMNAYMKRLGDAGIRATRLEWDPDRPALERAVGELAGRQVREVLVVDPTDFILERRLTRTCREAGLNLTWLTNPGFLNTREENADYRAGHKCWYMADYYQHQRKRLGILIEPDGEPVGGQWSFDAENRKKVPRSLLKQIPALPPRRNETWDEEARDVTRERFANHPGCLETLLYPTTHEAACAWLDEFLERRFARFGDYEDAIVEGESWLWHGVLTPSMNIGLLTPQQVVQRAVAFAEANDVPINSLEGFIRQIIGWREFMRATYEDLGVRMRNGNHWNHTRPLPPSFYDASTGIDPVDDVITRVLRTGYCHHIERLMVLGGFMFLCEIEPDAIYRWFMELFVDAYDWVMVPNVYAMSQNADGGLITTKPYFSGSAYIKKMSQFRHGEWADVWDGLYWRWIWKHRRELGKNPRWAMMCKMAERMDEGKRKRHLRVAEKYLDQLGRGTAMQG